MTTRRRTTRSTATKKPREPKKPARKVSIEIEFKGKYKERYGSTRESNFVATVSGGSITVKRASCNDEFTFKLTDIGEVLRLATEPIKVVPKEEA